MKNYYKKNVLYIVLSIFLSSCASDPIKVACVGDSITAGSGLKCQSNTAYPYVLGQLLGNDYAVLNCGRSGATALKKSNAPYWKFNEFTNVFAYDPDVVIIKLGTNDTKFNHWDAEGFAKDYQCLIDTFNTISSQPKIYCCLPVPVFKDVWGINDSTMVNGVIPIIEEIAKRNNLSIIDLYHSMKPYGAYFKDGVHPKEAGAEEMAKIFAKTLH